MHDQGYVFMTDAIAKFYNAVHVAGWLHHPTDRLAAVSLVGDSLVGQVSEVGLPHGTDASPGENRGFFVHGLLRQADFDEALELEMTTRDGWVRRVKLVDLADDRHGCRPSQTQVPRFRKMVKQRQNPRVLDIGGRNRSGFDRREHFPGVEYIVLDILEGENVDVVGDAHELSKLFPPDHFDAILSISVFEHLVMPWKVAVEMNRVMKPGAIALIQTHQTVAMHDLPWDFFRFSDVAWDGIFNKATGFEIVERLLDFEQFIIPTVYLRHKRDAERGLGFDMSSLIVRKIGDCRVDWPVSREETVATMYPEGVDYKDAAVLAGGPGAIKSGARSIAKRLRRLRKHWRQRLASRRPPSGDN